MFQTTNQIGYHHRTPPFLMRFSLVNHAAMGVPPSLGFPLATSRGSSRATMADTFARPAAKSHIFHGPGAPENQDLGARIPNAFDL